MSELFASAIWFCVCAHEELTTLFAEAVSDNLIVAGRGGWGVNTQFSDVAKRLCSHLSYIDADE